MKTEKFADNVSLSVHDENDIMTLIFDSETLTELADCYARIFNESWGERWSLIEAKSFLENGLRPSRGRSSLLALLCHNDSIVGFSLVVLTDCEHLAKHDMPIGISGSKQNYALSVVRYWCQLAKKKNLIIFRDLGIVKEFRNNTAYKNFGSLLELKILESAVNRGYRTMIHWTSPQSAIFKIGISLGNYPICFFPREERIVLKGNAALVCRYLSEVAAGNRNIYHELSANRHSYFCD